MAATRILVVASDADLRDRLTRGLAEQGCAVEQAVDATSALARISGAPDALMIEVDLPDADGRDLHEALRARGIDAPAVFLAPRCDVGEAIGRTRALLQSRRTAAPLTCGAFSLDPAAHAIRGEIGAASLTPTEYRVLAALAEHRGVIVRRKDLVRAAWPPDVIVSDNSLDQYITRLRGKLRTVTTGAAIVTTRGIGYRLE
jgi:DNA-binding response OmpR family regulator